MDNPDSSVAAAIKRARTAAGWSQRELAKRAGVHQPQVARAESGEDLQLSLLTRLALPLGLSLVLQPAAAADNSHQAETAADGVSPTPAPSAGGQQVQDVQALDAVEASYKTWRIAYPDVDPQVFAVLARLTRAGRHVEAATEQVAALHGMNAGEVLVLGALRRRGAPYESTPTGLKQTLWISLPGLKKQLDRLETLGMVTRISNPHDRRGLIVRLTALGHDALNDLVSHPKALVYKALLDMPSEQLAELSVLLRALLSRLDSETKGLPY
jgi:DNA-binding MarR family transcriptional regulator/DNA-binding XRE family transcriptional regulator